MTLRALSLFLQPRIAIRSHGCGVNVRKSRARQPFCPVRFAKPASLAVKLGEARPVVESPRLNERR